MIEIPFSEVGVCPHNAVDRPAARVAAVTFGQGHHRAVRVPRTRGGQPPVKQYGDSLGRSADSSNAAIQLALTRVARVAPPRCVPPGIRRPCLPPRVEREGSSVGGRWCRRPLDFTPLSASLAFNVPLADLT